MKTWYEKLGYYENPFTIKPALSGNIYGYDNETKKVISLMKNGEIVLLHGDYGLGKTTITNGIIDEFGGKKNLIYISCNRFEEDLDIHEIVQGSGTFLSKILKKKRRNLYLILDESQALPKDIVGEIYEAYMDNVFKSIVFITTNEDILSLNEELKERIKRVELKGFEESQAISIVYERLEGDELITPENIKKIFRISGGNPRTFLSYCEEAFRKAYSHNKHIDQKEFSEMIAKI